MVESNEARTGGIKMSLQSIEVSTLARKIIHKEPLFLLDVRNEQAFTDWKIEGESVEILNAPYMELLESVDSVIEQLPRDKQVIVICAKEGSSIFIGEMLIQAGVKNVSYVKGGMRAWSQHIEPLFVGDLSTGGEIYQFVRMGKGCLSYMIISKGEALVIDPIRHIQPYHLFAEKKDATITHIIDTHLHADHISGGRRLREETGATYWLPPGDAEEVSFPFAELTEDTHSSSFNMLGLSIQVLHSPGHTKGSTSLLIDDMYFFTGDILFIESIGRPDLAGKAGDWAEDLRETLYRKYRGISEDVITLPAHFGSVKELNEDGTVMSSFANILANNVSMNIEEKEKFHQLVSENLPVQPNSFTEIRHINMGKYIPTEEEQQEMEVGPNRCAVENN